jgi:hypothetical protein
MSHPGELFEWVDGWVVIPAPHARNPWYAKDGHKRRVGLFLVDEVLKK